METGMNLNPFRGRTESALVRNQSRRQRRAAVRRAAMSSLESLETRRLLATQLTADAGGPYNFYEGSPTIMNVIDGTGSSSNFVNTTNLTYAWDLDNDGSFGVANATNPKLTLDTNQSRGPETGAITNFDVSNLNGPSNFVIRLYVKGLDKNGTTPLWSNQNSTAVHILNAPPTITNVSQNGPKDEGLNNTGNGVTLSVTASDPGGDTLSYSYDFDGDGNWDEGDGTFAGGTDSGSLSSSSNPHVYDDNGVYNAKVRVVDQDGGVTDSTIPVTINNVAPTATLSNDGPAPEGSSSASVAFSGQFDPSVTDTNAGFHYAYDFDNNGTWDSGDGTYAGSPDTTGTAPVPGAFLLDDGSYTIKARIIDKDGGSSDVTTNLEVTNVPPQMSNLLLSSDTINEGDSASISGSFTDPGSLDTFTLHIDWGDGSAVQDVSLGNATSFSNITHTYADDNPTATSSDVNVISVTVEDDDGGVSTAASAPVTVNNVAPTVTASETAPGAESTTPWTGAGSFTDPALGQATESFTATVDYGDGSGAQPLALSGSSFSLSHMYTGSGTYTVTVTVNDDDGGSGTFSLNASVANVPPSVTLSGNHVRQRNPSNLKANVGLGIHTDDPGSDDTVFTYFIDWGDTDTAHAPVNYTGPQPTTTGVTPAVNGRYFTFTGPADTVTPTNHDYYTDGTYTIKVWAFDGQDWSAASTFSITITPPPH
jgi:hypothetical protein